VGSLRAASATKKLPLSVGPAPGSDWVLLTRDLGEAAGIAHLTPGQGGVVEREGVQAARGLAIVVAQHLHLADFYVWLSAAT
jgi:hypothetical protein